MVKFPIHYNGLLNQLMSVLPKYARLNINYAFLSEPPNVYTNYQIYQMPIITEL